MRATGITVVLALSASCSFAPTAVHGDPEPDPDAAAVDAAEDVDAPESPDAADDADSGSPVPCDLVAAVMADTLPAPELVAELSSPERERDPVLTRDGLTIYFSSQRPGGLGGTDIWMSTRPGRDAPFETPTLVGANINTASSENKITFSADGLHMAVASNRPGGAGDADIWIASRTTTTEDFSGFAPVTIVNTVNQEQDPELSADGLRLYYASSGEAQDISLAERASVEEAFGAPRLLANVSTAGNDADPALTGDELVMVFARNSDVWYATRTDLAADFTDPAPIGAANSDSGDGDPYITEDGCELFFFSNRSGDDEIYRIRVGP